MVSDTPALHAYEPTAADFFGVTFQAFYLGHNLRVRFLSTLTHLENGVSRELWPESHRKLPSRVEVSLAGRPQRSDVNCTESDREWVDVGRLSRMLGGRDELFTITSALTLRNKNH